MTGNYEYDAIGELFRQRLENHRTPVDGNGWNEIERRLGHRKDKSVARWWIGGSIAAAAAIALLLMVRTEPAVMVAAEESVPAHYEATSTIVEQEMTDVAQVDVAKPAEKSVQNNALAVLQPTDRKNQTNELALNDSMISSFNDSMIAFGEPDEVPLFHYSIIPLFNDSVTRLLSHSVTQEKLNLSLLDDEDLTIAGKTDKWMLVAVLGTGGYTYGNNDENRIFEQNASVTKASIGNDYAANLSHNIRSFDYMTMGDFKTINHLPPFSLGMTARKSLGRYGAIESGLVYNYLMSHFVWSDWANNNVRQTLHYVGIPVNMILYPQSNPKPNWRFYVASGFMIEKGVRAVYRQKTQREGEQRITTVRSSIDGMQWSLTGALGINYRVVKGFSFYFEPRLGYFFKNNQPISIRTEWPVNFSINMGLNYEL